MEVDSFRENHNRFDDDELSPQNKNLSVFNKSKSQIMKGIVFNDDLIFLISMHTLAVAVVISSGYQTSHFTLGIYIVIYMFIYSNNYIIFIVYI